MLDFEIIIGNEMYEFNEDISTVICIRVGSDYFPNQEWWDFPDAILGMWINNLLKSKEISDEEFILYFMDGPYELKVYKDSEMELLIQCINTRYKPKVEYTFNCNYYDFMEAVYKALKTLNYLIYKNNLHESKFSGIYKQTVVYMKEIKSVLK